MPSPGVTLTRDPSPIQDWSRRRAVRGRRGSLISMRSPLSICCWVTVRSTVKGSFFAVGAAATTGSRAPQFMQKLAPSGSFAPH